MDRNSPTMRLPVPTVSMEMSETSGNHAANGRRPDAAFPLTPDTAGGVVSQSARGERDLYYTHEYVSTESRWPKGLRSLHKYLLLNFTIPNWSLPTRVGDETGEKEFLLCPAAHVRPSLEPMPPLDLITNYHKKSNFIFNPLKFFEPYETAFHKGVGNMVRPNAILMCCIVCVTAVLTYFSTKSVLRTVSSLLTRVIGFTGLFRFMRYTERNWYPFAFFALVFSLPPWPDTWVKMMSGSEEEIAGYTAEACNFVAAFMVVWILKFNWNISLAFVLIVGSAAFTLVGVSQYHNLLSTTSFGYVLTYAFTMATSHTIATVLDLRCRSAWWSHQVYVSTATMWASRLILVPEEDAPTFLPSHDHLPSISVTPSSSTPPAPKGDTSGSAAKKKTSALRKVVAVDPATGERLTVKAVGLALSRGCDTCSCDDADSIRSTMTPEFPNMDLHPHSMGCPTAEFANPLLRSLVVNYPNLHIPHGSQEMKNLHNGRVSSKETIVLSREAGSSLSKIISSSLPSAPSPEHFNLTTVALRKAVIPLRVINEAILEGDNAGVLPTPSVTPPLHRFLHTFKRTFMHVPRKGDWPSLVELRTKLRMGWLGLTYKGKWAREDFSTFRGSKETLYEVLSWLTRTFGFIFMLMQDLSSSQESNFVVGVLACRVFGAIFSVVGFALFIKYPRYRNVMVLAHVYLLNIMTLGISLFVSGPQAVHYALTIARSFVLVSMSEYTTARAPFVLTLVMYGLWVVVHNRFGDGATAGTSSALTAGTISAIFSLFIVKRLDRIQHSRTLLTTFMMQNWRNEAGTGGEGLLTVGATRNGVSVLGTGRGLTQISSLSRLPPVTSSSGLSSRSNGSRVSSVSKNAPGDAYIDALGSSMAGVVSMGDDSPRREGVLHPPSVSATPSFSSPRSASLLEAEAKGL